MFKLLARTDLVQTTLVREDGNVSIETRASCNTESMLAAASCSWQAEMVRTRHGGGVESSAAVSQMVVFFRRFVRDRGIKRGRGVREVMVMADVDESAAPGCQRARVKAPPSSTLVTGSAACRNS